MVNNSKQWIEIYNTTDLVIGVAAVESESATAISLSLRFTPFTTDTGDPPADTLGFRYSLQRLPWQMDDAGFQWGISGSSAWTTVGSTLQDRATLSLRIETLIMRQLTGTHSDAVNLDNSIDGTKKRAKQLEQFKSWKRG